MTDPWDIVSAPIHYVRAPRRSLSLRAFLTIAVLVMVAVSLWAIN